ncbi:hypothetical protein [Promicromonospora kroppenstedtii]|uniref:hypothetical protein n=1 Tax=Promicromonospora kroppenstedtii TaxID=440482 RepID=UPI00055F2587|nr:hypothetical protein [Promicromonospora kroppenstedtii]
MTSVQPVGPTRWEALFNDLEAQARAQSAAEADALVSELTRAEHATMTLADRFRAVVGGMVTLELLDGAPLRGVVVEAADEWVLLRGVRPEPLSQHLVPLAAVAAAHGLARQAVSATSRRDALGLGPVLRSLQRDRARVVVRTLRGAYGGRVARVGRDHLDIDLLDGRGTRLVPFTALLVVSESP